MLNEVDGAMTSLSAPAGAWGTPDHTKENRVKSSAIPKLPPAARGAHAAIVHKSPCWRERKNSWSSSTRDEILRARVKMFCRYTARFDISSWLQFVTLHEFTLELLRPSYMSIALLRCCCGGKRITPFGLPCGQKSRIDNAEEWYARFRLLLNWA